MKIYYKARSFMHLIHIRIDHFYFFENDSTTFKNKYLHFELVFYYCYVKFKSLKLKFFMVIILFFM